VITNDVRERIQAEMRAAFPAAEARVAQFYAMQEYHLGWRDAQLQPSRLDPGKLIRPLMVLTATAAAGGSTEQALPLAAGIQLLHDFSLIHDDIEDDSALRRGRPTLWHLWGLAQGINAGDGMFTLAHLAIHRLADGGVPAATVLAVLRRFDEVVLQICEGQFLDISFEGRLDITPDDYLAMIQRKTAVLLSGAAELGAMVAGAASDVRTALADFGLAVGLAFQIEDDILGIWGTPEQTGKPRAADLYRRKLSLPVVYALAHAADAEQLAALYANRELSDAQVDQALAILAQCDAAAYCREQAAVHHRNAFAALARLEQHQLAQQAAVAQLRSMAEQLVGRTT
jgi:geranylgeranyl diphosphate synthase, type I